MASTIGLVAALTGSFALGILVVATIETARPPFSRELDDCWASIIARAAAKARGDGHMFVLVAMEAWRTKIIGPLWRKRGP